MKKNIISVLLTLLLVMTGFTAFAFDTQIVLKSAVTDPVNKQVILSGNINMAGDRPILIRMYSSANEVKFSDLATSDSKGNFSTVIGVDSLLDGEYKIYAAYRNSPDFLLYTFNGIGTLTPEKISASVTNGTVFMKDEKTVDSDFDFAQIKLANLKTLTGTLKTDSYTVKGLPEGLTADITATSEDTLKLKISGKAQNAVTNECNISVNFKSSIIASGNANTDSDEITGITLYPHTYGQRVITDTQNVGLSMETYLTPSQNGAVVTLMHRSLDVNGTLEKDTHYTYSENALSGMKLNVVADKSTNTIKISLSGSSNSNVTSALKITDFVFKSIIAQNAAVDSNPITITVSPTTVTVVSPSGNNIPSGISGGSSGGSVISTTPSVTPAPVIPVVYKNLTDIANHWGKGNIEKLNKLGYISGYEDDTFRPDNNITRAEFITLVVRILGLSTSKYNNAFSDVNTADWHAKYVQTALDNGLISKDNEFRPNDFIRRDEITKIAVNAYLLSHNAPETATPVTSFLDASSIPDWATQYVLYAVNLGLVQGDSQRNFNPAGMATRAESATILSRLVDCLGL